MNDAINRQAAINAIDCDIEITGRENVERVARTLQKFINRIRELPSVDVNYSWIKCSERMPETNKEVLATCENFAGKRYVIEAEWTGERWLSVWDEFTMPWAVRKYIAWTYLPKPYKD